MRFKFRSGKLERQYQTEEGARRYPPEVVDAFFETMSIIRASVDERDLYALKGFHFEKLEGQRGKVGDRSLRLNKQWRLTLRFERDTEGKFILIIAIEKHYRT